jgi:hypothetical protein
MVDPILNFTISAQLLHQINEFWHQHQFPARAPAVRWLIEAALKHGLKPAPGEVTDASQNPPADSSY